MSFLGLLAMANPLNLLVVAQVFFIAVGIVFLDFNVTLLDVAAAVLTACTLELFMMYREGKPLRFPTSALAAALGIVIFMRASDPLFFSLAAAIAILSKYVLTWRGGHIFNPSNIAILCVVFLFSGFATIELTQWGNSAWYFALVAVICLGIAWRAGALPTTLSFLAGYAALLAAFIALRPDVYAAHHYGLLGPSLILFASFMITDPRTSPQGFYARIAHGIAVASLYFVIESFGLRYGVFAASFLVTILNLGSRELVRAFPSPRLSNVPNAYAAVVCVVFVAGTYMNVFAQTGIHLNPLRLSPQFALQGIEGGALLRCSADPVLAPVQAGLPTGNANAYGAAWGDFDGDGDDDLFVSYIDQPSRLFRNDAGSFVDATQESGIVAESSASAFFADYDGDRRLDLFLAYPGIATRSGVREFESRIDDFLRPREMRALRVYRNDGGRFRDATAAVGLASFTTHGGPIGTMSFADFDNDGRLDFAFVTRGDLFSANEVFGRIAFEKSVFDPFFETASTLACDPASVRTVLAAHRSILTLDDDETAAFIGRNGCVFVQHRIPLLNGSRPEDASLRGAVEVQLNTPGEIHLFRNAGGRFVASAALEDAVLERLPEKPVIVRRLTHPFDSMSGRLYQSLAFDYDDDQRADLFVAGDFGASILLKNLGDFEFRDVTVEAGLDYSGNGMGADVADVDRDGDVELAVTNVRGDFLYENTGGAFAMMRSDLSGLGVGWGVTFLDYDLDGWDDLFIANGDFMGTQFTPFGAAGKDLFRADALYQNRGGDFVDATWDDLCPTTESGWALAVADYDNDGDPDAFLGNRIISPHAESRGVLYENATDGKHFLKVVLEGMRSNSFGVGAVIAVSRGGETQTKQVVLGSSMYSQNSLTSLFGLGDDAAPVSVRVQWPSGRVSVLENVAPDQTLVVRE
jgi:Na+-translocating ferredoxin:NAD+ oxidoreductase RnfD subunit